jgi:hypothetical protein
MARHYGTGQQNALFCRVDDSRCQMNCCSAAEDPLLLDVLYVRRTASVGVTGDGHPLAAS